MHINSFHFSGTRIKTNYKNSSKIDDNKQRPYQWRSLLVRILNEKTAKYKITHDGETYYFCSVKCKKKFKRNRSKFTK